MIRDRLNILKAIHIFTDASIIIIAYLVAYYIRFYTPLFVDGVGKFYPLEKYAALLVYLVPIYLFIYFFFRLYSSEPEEYRRHPVLKIVVSNMVGLLLFLTFLYFQKENNISRIFLLLFLIINIILTVGSRILITNTRLKLKRGWKKELIGKFRIERVRRIFIAIE